MSSSSVGRELMIAVEVILNNEVIAVAGSEELGVLSASVNASGKLGPKSNRGPDIEGRDYHVSLNVHGLTSRENGREDEHQTWVERTELGIGDVVTFRLVEVSDADAAVESRTAGGNMNDTSERRWYEMAKEAYFKLKDKYE